MHHLISVVIITFNEELNIERCIKSVQTVADEVIVLDSFSTDKTIEICKRLNVRVIQRNWQGYAASKNYLNKQAKNSYLLSIDADEELNTELQQSILKIKSEGLQGVYDFSSYARGKWIRYSSIHIKTEFFQRSFNLIGDVVHETLSYPESLSKDLLNGELYHYSYVSGTQHKQRADNTLCNFKKISSKREKSTPFLSIEICFQIIKIGFMDYLWL